MKTVLITCLAATSLAAPAALPQWDFGSLFGGSNGGSSGGMSSLLGGSGESSSGSPSFGSLGSLAGGSGSGGPTKNDVTNGVCHPVTFIFARGTTEAGNMGSSVGPAVESALENTFGAQKVATQGVDYPADIQGAMSSEANPASAEGATTMAKLTKQALQNCPDTKIILGGYSQGAQQVHGALMNLQQGQVAAAITFGDPMQNVAFQNIDKSHTKIYCNQDDGVCSGTFLISAAHLSYGSQDSQSAAQFAKGIIGSV